jgi:RecA-family ATPase
LQLAFATATGTDWIATLPEAGRVLFVSAEDSQDELHRRLSHIARRKGRLLSEVDNLDLLSRAGRDAVLAAPAKGDILAATSLFQALRVRIKETEPALIVLDTLADLFGGDEIKRTHARQFVGILRGLAIDFGATVLLLAHPSLSGMTSGAGTSGSTAWSNSVRSRLYLERTDPKEDTDARTLTTKKANYGRVGDERILRWREGVFIPDFEAHSSSLIGDAADEQTFLGCLDEFERTGRKASPNRSKSYAPTLFSETPAARGTSAKRLAGAMERLFSKQQIHVVKEGPRSKVVERIVRGSAPKREGEE